MKARPAIRKPQLLGCQFPLFRYGANILVERNDHDRDFDVGRSHWVIHTGTTRSGQTIKMRRAARDRMSIQAKRLLPVPIPIASRMPRNPAANFGS